MTILKHFKNITFDEIRGTGTLRKRMLVTPSQDSIFDEKGEKIGKYRIKRTRLNTLIFI